MGARPFGRGAPNPVFIYLPGTVVNWSKPAPRAPPQLCHGIPGNGVNVKSQGTESHGQFAQVSSVGANVFSMLMCLHVASNLPATWSR